MIWLVARGMVFPGLSASAAVMPTSSSPPKENMITAMAISRPLTPLGKNPPSSHRLPTEACGPPLPLASSQPPNTIMAMIAATFTIDSQNSISPNRRTCSRLMPLTSTKKPSADTQIGISGHQYCT